MALSEGSVAHQRFRALALAGTALMLVHGAAARADESVVETRHTLEAGDLRLDYTAHAGRLAIRDVETGNARGFMFYVAYRVPGDPGRPVAFIWNGGPGAPATILHFETAGPYRAEDGALVPNAHSWLSEMDLVFVDPIGTGFSRPARAEYGDEFYGTLGDIASATEFVRAWRLRNEALDSPIILAGESWGAIRVASAAYQLEERGIPVGALLLISGGSGLRVEDGDSVLIDALRVTGFARTAFHYGLSDPSVGETLDEVLANAEHWVRERYALALARIDTLSSAERDAIAEELSDFIGIGADQISRESLVITTRAFRDTLLSGREATLGVFDMRLNTADPHTPTGASSVREPILRYLRYRLSYRTDLPYIGLENWSVGYAPGGETPRPPSARWNYATGPVTEEEYAAAIAEAIRRGDGPPRIGPPLPSIVDALELNPAIQVLVASGAYDSLANCAGIEELAARQSEPVRAAVTTRCYEGGHMMYRDAPVLDAFNADMRALARALR